jgi:hypothetical protein
MNISRREFAFGAYFARATVCMVSPLLLPVGLKPSFRSSLPNFRSFGPPHIPEFFSVIRRPLGVSTLITPECLWIFRDPLTKPLALLCPMQFLVRADLSPANRPFLRVSLTTLHVVAGLANIPVPSGLIKRRII